MLRYSFIQIYECSICMCFDVQTKYHQSQVSFVWIRGVQLVQLSRAFHVRTTLTRSPDTSVSSSYPVNWTRNTQPVGKPRLTLTMLAFLYVLL